MDFAPAATPIRLQRARRRSVRGRIVTDLVRFRAAASIEDQAREWLVRMDGDKPLSAAERQALQEWMARSTAHRSELVRIAKFWKQANILTELNVDPCDTIGHDDNRHFDNDPQIGADSRTS